MDLALDPADIIGSAVLITVALIGASATIVSAHRKTREEIRGEVATQVQPILQELKTGNGHTLGQGMARLEDMHRKLDNDVDEVKVEVREGRADGREARAELRALNMRQAETNARVEKVDANLTRHLKEVDPYLQRAMKEWPLDG